MHRFIGAEGPVCANIIQAETLHVGGKNSLPIEMPMVYDF